MSSTHATALAKAAMPPSPIESLLKEINTAHIRIADALAKHHERLGPVLINHDPEKTPPSQDDVPPAPQSPLGLELVTLRDNAIAIAVSAEHLSDNLAI